MGERAASSGDAIGLGGMVAKVAAVAAASDDGDAQEADANHNYTARFERSLQVVIAAFEKH